MDSKLHNISRDLCAAKVESQRLRKLLEEAIKKEDKIFTKMILYLRERGWFL